MSGPAALPSPLRRPIEALADRLLSPEGVEPVDFTAPPGEPALDSPDSVAWRVFANPATLFIGGVAAVLLELAEPRVRHGVWDHSSFRERPLERLQRTGLAAMLTVYGPASAARAAIERVNQLHARIEGRTKDGLRYRADDPELLVWVHATAAFGFLEAKAAFGAPVADADRDLYYAEVAPVAALYGAVGAPASEAERRALFAAMAPKLEPSPTIDEFLAIMEGVPALPRALRPLQRLLVRAAIDLLPDDLARRLRLEGRRLSPWQRALVRAAAAPAGRLPLRNWPAVQACRRLGLPEDWLYRRPLSPSRPPPG